MMEVCVRRRGDAADDESAKLGQRRRSLTMSLFAVSAGLAPATARTSGNTRKYVRYQPFVNSRIQPCINSRTNYDVCYCTYSCDALSITFQCAATLCRTHVAALCGSSFVMKDFLTAISISASLDIWTQRSAPRLLVQPTTKKWSSWHILH